LQLVSDPVRTVFRPRKNERTVEVRPFQQNHEQIEFLLSGDRIDRMGDGFGRGTARANFDRFGIPQDRGGEPFDLWRQGGRKKQGLAVRRDVLNDAPNIRHESHVEHAIDFIEHENINVAKMNCALLEVIEEAAGGGDHDIHPVLQILFLFSVTHTAMYHRLPDIGEAPVIAKSRFDLRRQLAGRLEHEAAELSVPREQGQDWERKGRRFAGAGLRGSDQIFSLENNRKGPQLNWGRFGKTHRLRAANDFRRKSKIVK
ncbi:MAG: hypothetical protein QOI22_1968, partial [Verrucomicrobiota bacterium]